MTCNHDHSFAGEQSFSLSRRELMQLASLSVAALAAPRALLAAIAQPGSMVDANKRFPYFQSEPVSYLQVKMQDRFWAPRQKTTHKVSVQWITSGHDPAGGLDEFKKDAHNYVTKVASEEMEHVKAIEAMASVVGAQADAAIAGFIDKWAQPLIQGQGADGYLGAHFPISRQRPSQRWKAAWWSHEDYMIGHYIESAIAYREATGSDAMYASAVRAADNMVVDLLNSKHAYAPPTPQIEQALMRLYAVTGNTQYLRLCGWLLEQRGHHEGRTSYGPFKQDHMPVKEQRKIEGHAVTAAYLFNGVTHYVGATGDAAYRDAVLAVWDDLVERKMYLHGASGTISSRVEGHRTNPYCILPDDAYGESCSVFANFQWTHSLFRLTGQAKYIDAAERMLYNAFYASLSLAGDSSFYANVAQTGLFLPGAIPDEPHPPITRSKELATSCCPPNIVKLFNTVGGYFYSTDKDGIYVKHYGASSAQIPWGDGVTLTQRTDYPWDGTITVLVESKKPQRFALRLRLPSWARSHTLSVNGKKIEVGAKDGWLTLTRRWKSQDWVELTVPMPIEQVRMPAQFKEYENLVALQRGPIVYCLEQQDFPSPKQISAVYLPDEAQFVAEHLPDFLGGVTVLRGKLGLSSNIGEEAGSICALFIPYGVWGNREVGAMRIWFNATRAHPIESHQADFRSGESCLAG